MLQVTLVGGGGGGVGSGQHPVLYPKSVVDFTRGGQVGCRAGLHKPPVQVLLPEAVVVEIKLQLPTPPQALVVV